MKFICELFRPWTWRMAWRDSRRERRRLLVFSLSIFFGVAALVAIGSLRSNLGDTIELKAKELLGADLSLRSRQPFHEGHLGQGSETQLSARQAGAAGIIKEFTGISDPYEEPEDAEIVIDTREFAPDEAAQKILLYLEREGFIGGEPV